MGGGYSGQDLWDDVKFISGATAVEETVKFGKELSDGTVAAEAPKPIQTTTSVGSALDVKAATFDESASKKKSINKKRLGTRGLQIPLTSTASTTTQDVQI